MALVLFWEAVKKKNTKKNKEFLCDAFSSSSRCL